jgi:hypothetical protein
LPFNSSIVVPAFTCLNYFDCSDRNERRKAGKTGKPEPSESRNDRKAGMTKKAGTTGKSGTTGIIAAPIY